MEEKIKNLKVWLSISNLNNVPDVLLLMAMIVDFAEDAFETTEWEQDYETVRRVRSVVKRLEWKWDLFQGEI